jgi:hypothetical protein
MGAEALARRHLDGRAASLCPAETKLSVRRRCPRDLDTAFAVQQSAVLSRIGRQFVQGPPQSPVPSLAPASAPDRRFAHAAHPHEGRVRVPPSIVRGGRPAQKQEGHWPDGRFGLHR